VPSRWLRLAGLRLAAGRPLFFMLVWRPTLRAAGPGLLETRLQLMGPLILAGALALAALAAFLLVPLEPGSSGTRCGHRMEIGGGIAALAAVASLASFRVRTL